MKEKSAAKPGFLIPRIFISLAFGAIGVLLTLLTVALYPGGIVLAAHTPQKVPHTLEHRELSFEDRVAYQRAIEEVYWRHRIWPKERPDPKPSLDQMMPLAQLKQKVEDYLSNSQALENYWQQPITAQQLQAEIERLAQHTQQPELLHELFAALGNDPFVIAECLARSTLSERLLTDFYTHKERRQESFESWRAGRDKRMLKAIAAPTAAYTIPTISDTARGPTEYTRTATTTNAPTPTPGCIGDTWVATSTTNAPTGRMDHTAVWTGAEMIVWGGLDSNTGGKYVPATDSWTATSTINAPTARSSHTAVWTGSEMIVWGGYQKGSFGNYFNTGGRYNPSTDSWTTTSTSKAPTARSHHTAVWTGSEMIVWGGTPNSGFVNTGGRYNPVTDSWTATTTNNVPAARAYHTAVWTGSQMIVWGGSIGAIWTNTGGRYDPTTDSWTTTSTANVPIERADHTAVWTGSEMIVWGGRSLSGRLNTGLRYNPGTNSWTATSTANAPAARYYHTAVWTGSEMVVWGGQDFSSFDSGGKYNPGTNSWTATSTDNAPDARYGHTAVWTGSEMIVWGVYDTGGRYCTQSPPPPSPTPTSGCDNLWTATSLTNAPTAREYPTAVWTGSEMIVWGGDDGSSSDAFNTGGRYTPGMDSWLATGTTSAPTSRSNHTAVWTGSEMIVWGGYNFGSGNWLNTGGRYNPGSNSWTATTTTNAPTARGYHTAVWTGNEMIVWGGYNGSELNSGGRYNPGTDTWTPISTINAPSGRTYYTAVWTGSEMIVWGGYNGSNAFNNGGRYNPATDTWTAISMTNAPTARSSHAAVWTGSEMIVWGGYGGADLNTGGRYNPTANSWTATSTTNAPTARSNHTAVWTGGEMIVWSGDNGSFLKTGGRYNPGADSWMLTTTINAPIGRDFFASVWTGNEMIVWGGYVSDFSGITNTGGRYCAQSLTTPTPSPSATPPTPTPAPTPTPTSGTPTPTPTLTPTPTPALTPTPIPAQALNISTRMRVDTGNNVLIGGFIITGTAPKNVAIRGIGPSLGAFGVPDALSDPTLELHNSSGALLLQNDNWQDDPIQAAQLVALGLGLQNPNESGIVTSLQPNAYTVILAGKNDGTGVGLVEVYDTNQTASSQLANISTRGFVLTGSNVMIGGFILGGNNNTHVVVRGIGPSLAQVGVSNPLADPTLELHNSNGALLVSNDNWQDDSFSAVQLTALGLAPQIPLESGIYMSLPPGAFTAILAGKNGGTGVGLVEVYNVH